MKIRKVYTHKINQNGAGFGNVKDMHYCRNNLLAVTLVSISLFKK
jgi:hypothetical protein